LERDRKDLRRSNCEFQSHGVPPAPRRSRLPGIADQTAVHVDGPHGGC